MSVPYSLIARTNRSTGEVRIYAQVYTAEQESLDQIAEQLAYENTLTKTDVVAVLQGYLDHIKRGLLNGHSFQLGGIGNIFPTLQSEGSDSVDKFNASMIKRVRIRLSTSLELKSELRKARFYMRATKKKEAEALKTHKEELQDKVEAAADGDNP